MRLALLYKAIMGRKKKQPKENKNPKKPSPGTSF